MADTLKSILENLYNIGYDDGNSDREADISVVEAVETQILEQIKTELRANNAIMVNTFKNALGYAMNFVTMDSNGYGKLADFRDKVLEVTNLGPRKKLDEKAPTLDNPKRPIEYMIGKNGMKIPVGRKKTESGIILPGDRKLN